MLTIENVSIALAPGCVVYFSDYVFERFAVVGKTVVKAHRVEAVAEVGKVREQSDRPAGPIACLPLDEIPDDIYKRSITRTKVIASPKSRKRWP
jgi:hypothetical protein